MSRLLLPICAAVLVGCAAQKQTAPYEITPECQNNCVAMKKVCDHDCYGGQGPNLGCLPSCEGSYNRCLEKCRVPITGSTAPAASEIPARDVVRAFLDAWQKHDVEAMSSLCHTDAQYTEVATAKVYGCADYMRVTFSGAPDFGLDVAEIIRDANHAAVVWVMRGTHTGDWPYLPATGAPFAVRGVSVIEIDEARIRRVADYWDLSTLLKQLGRIPGRPPAGQHP